MKFNQHYWRTETLYLAATAAYDPTESNYINNALWEGDMAAFASMVLSVDHVYLSVCMIINYTSNLRNCGKSFFMLIPYLKLLKNAKHAFKRFFVLLLHTSRKLKCDRSKYSTRNNHFENMLTSNVLCNTPTCFR